MSNTDDNAVQSTDATELFADPPAAMKNQYNSRIGSCKFIFKDGTEANFTGGRYFTNNQTEIAELEHEVAVGHPIIYVDPNKVQVDTANKDPLNEIRRQAIAQYLAQQAAIDKNRDMGTVEQGALQGIGTTATVGAAMADSTGSAVGTGVVTEGSTAGANVVNTSTASKLAALKAK